MSLNDMVCLEYREDSRASLVCRRSNLWGRSFDPVCKIKEPTMIAISLHVEN